MNTHDVEKSIADLAAEIQRESEPDHLVGNIMLTIFGADTIAHPFDEKPEPEGIK